ncbi:hypothetical protein EDB83DRAFT_2313780 [Lactarius deliciosus]|nr:hypothetical protein EDB83DRAFT_2313780 [Lactarius deliciosus]
MVRIEVIQLGFLPLRFPELVLGLLLAQRQSGIGFLLGKPVYLCLVSTVLLSLGIPSGDFGPVFAGPSVLECLGSFLGGQRNGPLKVPSSILKAWADSLSRVFNNTQHVLAVEERG